MSDQDHGPGVRLPPPVMVAGLLAAAWLLRQVVPVPIGPPLPAFGPSRSSPPSRWSAGPSW